MNYSLLVTVIEFIIGIAFWWIGVYLISQNPYRRIIWLIFALFFSVSIYFSTYIFLYSAIYHREYSEVALLLKSVEWSIYLPVAFFYHISFGDNYNKRQKSLILISYATAILCIVLEMFTSLTRNYSLMNSPQFNGDLASATGTFFGLSAAYINIALVLSIVNLKRLINKAEKNSIARKRLSLVFWGLIIAMSMSPLVVLGYYNVIPNASELSSVCYLLISMPLFYSVIKFNLFIDDTKIVFNKSFLFSTFYLVTILCVLYFTIYISGVSLNSRTLILPFVLTYLIIASHPFYSWISTFANDLMYHRNSGFSVVNDTEVYEALKNYANPSTLEGSSLLRLKQIAKSNKEQVDSLRELIKSSIEYFRPTENEHRRIKSNLKYHLLKMLVFDQAEEGQILWELGFEGYPVKILSSERRYRAPLFKIESPADYTYTSRNAFLALKKEAIHDITWRISYQEKSQKRK